MELYRIYVGHRPLRSLLLWWCFVVIVWPCVFTSPVDFQGRVSDECDWSGSGLENIKTWNGVIPIYLRCQAGKIKWQYPRGALRIILRLGHSNKEFQGCIKVSGNSIGANLYLEGHQQLHNLYNVNNNSSFVKNPRVCFQSTGGQVALFLDALVGTNTLKKDVFSFMYDLQATREKSYSECRPCTDRELIYYFCTSDFVARGSISSIYQNEPLKRTELTVRSHQVFRDLDPKVFIRRKTDSDKTAYFGVVHRPFECGTKVGFGDFLFMGRWRLGDPILRCVPRWTEWKKVRRKALFAENTDCMLE